MFNFKILKIIICFLFIFLTLTTPIGNVFAEDIVDPLLLIFPPFAGIKTIISATGGLGGAIDLIGNPVGTISQGIAASAGALICTAARIILDIGQMILYSAVNSSSTWLSPTDFDANSETYNNVVATGWGIVRNVANAALVIGLVVIAINIILGREENKAKKTLINFIIIALLINFTPIICGFIIDGSNILTKSFVAGGIDNSMVGNLAGKFTEIFNDLGTDNKNPVGTFVIMLVFLMFALVSFFIYTLYALLFIGRSIILWLLVIVSPIAFATKVFPESKYIKKIFPSITYWDDWWESFLQWCVIGIPAGMSIYLANMTISKLTLNINTSGGIEDMAGSLVSAVIQCLTPFIVLVAGFFISISAGGQIGSAVSGIASNVWTKTGGRAVDRGKELAAAPWVKAAGYVEGRAGAVGTWAKEGATGRIGGAISNVFGNEKIDTSTKEGREEGRYKFREYIGKPRELAAKYSLVAPGTVGQKSKEETEAAEFAKGVSFNNYEKLSERYSQPQRTAIEKKLAEEDLSKFLEGAKTPIELERRLKSIAATGNDKTKNAAFLNTINNTKAGTTDWGKVFKTDIGKSVSSMSAKDVVEKLTPNSLGNVDVFEKLTLKQLNAIIDRGSREQTDAIKSLLTGSGSKALTDRKDTLENIKNLPGPVDQIEEAEQKLDDLNKKIVNLIKII